ncbi:MAG TPA: PBP1A family penicillin-binding protein [Candidatus Tectomicrobia bacterium]
MRPRRDLEAELDAFLKPQKRYWLRWVLLSIGLLFVLILAAAAGVGMVIYQRLVADLPQVSELEHYQPSLVTKVYDRYGELIADFFIEKRILVALEDIPLHVRQATIAAEDRRFYSHHGIDVRGILRAVRVNYQAGGTREGASTITQQVARTLFLNRDRTLARKMREAILAWRIEQHYRKDQILELYLNQIFYGHNAYGIEAAAQLYFGKSAKDLTLGEGALIAGLPPSPNGYSPLKNFPRSLQRRDHVLSRMVEAGYLTPEQAEEAQQEPIVLNPPPPRVHKAFYFVEYVRQYLEEQYGPTALYRGGFAVETTLDMHLQQLAEQTLKQGLVALDKRYGIYKGPLRRLALSGDSTTDAALVAAVTKPAEGETTVREGDRLTGVVLAVRDAGTTVAIKNTRGAIPPAGHSWVRQIDPALNADLRRQLFRRGDVIQVRVTKVDPMDKMHTLALDQVPLIQGALLTMDVGSGHVLAMVGGYDFTKSQFNRAVQAVRQPGSSFKPLIYTAALEEGMTPASTILDAPLTSSDAAGAKGWRPDNYDGKYHGSITLRSALTHSRNLPTVRLLDKVGLPTACATVKRLGITSQVGCYPSLALGASGVTLLELTASYGTFANGGIYNEPVVISKIVDWKGKVLLERFQDARQAVSPEVAYIMTSMMQSVIQHGTARALRVLARPAAGKTGTTNDYNDAWFIGYTPELVTGVWVGRDDHASLGDGETGGVVAAPIWLEFMKEAMKDRPIADFPIPPGVRFIRMNGRGNTIPAAESFVDGSALFEVFVDGSQPTKALNTLRKRKPRPTTPPTDQSPDDLRRDLDRLDREAGATSQ